MEVYVAQNPLLDEAQHIAIVSASGNGAGHDRPAKPAAMPSDMTVPEADAMARVRSLGINWRSLRRHAVAERAAVERQGKVWYSKGFVDALCSSWMTRDEAMRLMGVNSTSTFRYHVKNENIRESVQTPKGPRQKTICSLGDLRPRSRAEWLKLAHKVEQALSGQEDLFEEADGEVRAVLAKVKRTRRNSFSVACEL